MAVVRFGKNGARRATKMDVWQEYHPGGCVIVTMPSKQSRRGFPVTLRLTQGGAKKLCTDLKSSLKHANGEADES